MGFSPEKSCHLACSYPPAFYAFTIKIILNSCPFLSVELLSVFPGKHILLDLVICSKTRSLRLVRLVLNLKQ